MNILSVAYPFAPVGPSATGGAEQILTLLDRRLVRAGHKSIVIARGGSRVEGTLIAPAVPEGIVDRRTRQEAYRKWRAAIGEAILRYHIDVVHMHGVDFCEYLPETGPPVLVTLHLPVSFYADGMLRSLPAHTRLVCVSWSQRRSCPDWLEIEGVVENGIDLDHRMEQLQPASDYVIALGRICPEKGFHLAVDAANEAGVPLLLGGEVFPYEEHLRYFERELAPRLQAPHRFLGPLELERKLALLACARCLVAPSLVPETSSLVAMEAMSVGTPVVAFPAGALAELVRNGHTGFLAGSVAAMADAIRQVDRISREECRRTAEERFPAARMAGQYLELYDRLRKSSAHRSHCGAGSGIA
jgi:glycosyltransferase involved in cell wall biosynthesis